MTSSMEEHSLKRKSRSSGRERSIYLLFNSGNSKKAVALFEVKIMTIIIDGEELDIISDEDKVTGITDVLKEVVTLYDQYRETLTEYAACTPFGDHSLLFLPNESDPVGDYHPNLSERDFTRPNPHVFNLLTKKFDTKEEATFKPPSGRKVFPIAVTLMGGGDNYNNNKKKKNKKKKKKKKKKKEEEDEEEAKIYVFARRHCLQQYLPDPSFEAYDMVSKNWEILPSPWFNKNNLPADPTWGWTTEGYAVFQDFLIFCIHNGQVELPTYEIWSYNTLTKMWKRVLFTTTPLVNTLDDNGARRSFLANNDDEADDEEHHSEFRMWVGQAVVIGSFIYGYIPRLRTFVSFSCSKVSRSGEYDLSLGDKIIMERVDRLQYWKSWSDMERGYAAEITGAVGQIGDDSICLVKTIFSETCRVYNILQPVYIKTFRILPEGDFTGVQTFCLFMPRSEQFDYGMLASCFTVRTDKEHEKYDSKHLLSSRDTSVSRVEMMDTT